MIFGTLIYYVIKPKETCHDGKLNQAEERVDCGGVCMPCNKEIDAEDIKIEETQFVFGNKNQFDTVAIIRNPNSKYGAVNFSYEFQLLDKSGVVLERRAGNSFILPDENKFIIELNLYSTATPHAVNFEIKEVVWEEFLDYAEPKLNIYNKNYYEESEKNIIFGLLRNESYFDFNYIEVDVILRNGDGKIIALGKNEMRTIKSQEERDFKLIWPYRFGQDVKGVDIKAEANVFDSDNFIKKYLPSQKFQNYTY
jgi:hypothetical protein